MLLLLLLLLLLPYEFMKQLGLYLQTSARMEHACSKNRRNRITRTPKIGARQPMQARLGNPETDRSTRIICPLVSQRKKFSNYWQGTLAETQVFGFSMHTNFAV
jgi:hypothetical protein